VDSVTSAGFFARTPQTITPPAIVPRRNESAPAIPSDSVGAPPAEAPVAAIPEAVVPQVRGREGTRGFYRMQEGKPRWLAAVNKDEPAAIRQLRQAFDLR